MTAPLTWEEIERLFWDIEQRLQIKSAIAAGELMAVALAHCRNCRDCGDGPCCDACGSGAALAAWRQAVSAKP